MNMRIMRNALLCLAAATCLTLLAIGNVGADSRSPARTIRQSAIHTPAPQAGSCYALRHDWGNVPNGVKNLLLDITSRNLNGTSLVFVSVGEGSNAGKALGDARFTLYDVAPRSGV